jgi:TPP-dependent pyruvate/acetoin dehydrogenase alpha subunit
VAEQRLLDEGWLNAAEVKEMYAEARRKVDQAVSKVSKEPLPDPFKENWQALSSADLVEGQHEA